MPGYWGFGPILHWWQCDLAVQPGRPCGLVCWLPHVLPEGHRLKGEGFQLKAMNIGEVSE